MFTDFGCDLVHSALAVGAVEDLELSGSGVGVCSDQVPDFVSRFLTTPASLATQIHSCSCGSCFFCSWVQVLCGLLIQVSFAQLFTSELHAVQPGRVQPLKVAPGGLPPSV